MLCQVFYRLQGLQFCLSGLFLIARRENKKQKKVKTSFEQFICHLQIDFK